MTRPAREFWRVPRIWPDGECFILGGGPSLKGIDVTRLRGRRVIAVNNAYQLGDWIDVMFFGDCRWFNLHRKQLLDFAGLKVTTCEQHDGKPGIKVVKRQNSPFGLYKDPGRLAWNLNSGACAINLAVHFGVKRIVLLGYDMRLVDDESNWHRDHPNHVNPKKRGGAVYERFLRPFPAIADKLKEWGIECINATPGSALDVFPIVEPESLL